MEVIDLKMVIRAFFTRIHFVFSSNTTIALDCTKKNEVDAGINLIKKRTRHLQSAAIFSNTAFLSISCVPSKIVNVIFFEDFWYRMARLSSVFDGFCLGKACVLSIVAASVSDT